MSADYYHLSSGIIPVMKISGEWKYLLLRCFKYWDFPKGMVEPGEDPLETALRELEEETGINECQLPWGKDFIETEKYAKGKKARYYLGLVSKQEISFLPNPLTGIVEHHEYRWLTYEEARGLLVPRVQKVINWAESKLK